MAPRPRADGGPVRILFLYYGTMGIAGAYVEGLRLACEALEGVEATFAVSRYYRFPAATSRFLKVFFPFTERDPENRWTWHRLNALRSAVRFAELCLAYIYLFGYAVWHRIDIVNISVIDDYFVTAMLARALRMAGRRVHVTAHDAVPYVHRAAPGRRLGLLRRADTILVHYPHVRDEIAERYGIAREKIVVTTFPWAEVGPVLAADRLDACRRQVAAVVRDFERVFLFVGIVRPEKGIDVLLDAWQAMVGRAGKRLLLVVAGRPTPGVTLRQLPGLVTVEHYLSSEEFWAWLEAADVVVFPYRARYYAHSSAVLMAWLASRPVVTSDIPLFEQLVDERLGWRVPAGDAAALAESMENIAGMTTSTLRARGAAGREAVIASWRRLPDELTALIDRTPQAATTVPPARDDSAKVPSARP